MHVNWELILVMTGGHGYGDGDGSLGLMGFALVWYWYWYDNPLVRIFVSFFFSTLLHFYMGVYMFL